MIKILGIIALTFLIGKVYGILLFPWLEKPIISVLNMDDDEENNHSDNSPLGLSGRTRIIYSIYALLCVVMLNTKFIVLLVPMKFLKQHVN